MGEVEKFLEHHGVKGMHWGIHNAPTTKREAKTRAARAHAAKHPHLLSEDELNKFVSRLEKEKKLKSLVEEDLTPGKVAVKRFLGQQGKTVVGGVVGTAVGFAVKKALNKHFGAPPKGD